MRRVLSVFFWVVLMAVVCPVTALADFANPKLHKQLRSILGSDDGLLIQSTSGKTYFSHNPERKFIPASTLKLFTSFFVLETLGADFRCATEVYLRGNELLLKGYGDPFFVSDEIRMLAKNVAVALRAKGIKEISVAYADDTALDAFSIPGSVNSSNPYDAQSGALVANFNTIFVERRGAGFASAEPETPLTPFAETMAKKYLAKQKDRINIAQGGRKDGVRYALELFQVMLKEAGITVHRYDLAPQRLASFKLLLSHASSKTTADNVRGLLKYSNNFIANQLLVQAGAKLHGWPASLDKGLRAMRAFYVGKGYSDLEFVEGSGLSTENRASCAMFLRLLQSPEFATYRSLLTDDKKSGSLTASMSYVGYFGSDAFCLLCNDASTPLREKRERIFDILKNNVN